MRWAFLENQSVRTITKPERSRKAVGAVEGFERLPIMKALSAAPEACHSFQLSQAASGTPTKLTEVVARKGEREGDVPARMMILKMLTRKTVMSTWKSTVRPVKSEKRMTAVLALIHGSTGMHEARALGALHHEEVDDGRERDAAVDGADASVGLLELEGEDEAGEVLHDGARNEGDDDGDQNAEMMSDLLELM